MARNCPKEHVRSLVEGTLDLEDSLSQDLTAHIDQCSSCRKLKAKLEAKERAFRSALGAMAADDSSRCPSPAAIATVSEKGLDEADPGLVEHLSRCGMCRATLTSVNNIATPAKAPDETIAAARRRVAVARTKSDSPSSDRPGTDRPGDRSGSGRVASGRVSGRRIRTGRTPALVEAPPSRGLVAAAIIVFCATFAIFAVVRDGNTPTPSDDRTPSAKQPAPPKPEEKPAPPAKPAEKPAPQAPRPTELPQPGEVVAQGNNTLPLPPVEEEPREPEVIAQPEVVRPDAVNPDPKKPDEKPATPDKPATGDKPKQPEQPAPKQPEQPAPRPSTPEPATLACKIDAVTGPVELRKKAEKTWKKLAVADSVHEGDGLRSKGEDGMVTFASKARVSFDADSTGTVSIKATGVCVTLESGNLEGESLAYDGLEIRELNGTVTAWKGAKFRLERSEKGLRVCVDKGTANAGNELGTVTVHAGQEVLLVKDRRPARPISQSGPYRTPREGGSSPKGK